MYQTGDTIRETIEAIQRHEYVLPAIQREFVWKPEQIAKLADEPFQWVLPGHGRRYAATLGS